jgi:hypothetical protein
MVVAGGVTTAGQSYLASNAATDTTMTVGTLSYVITSTYVEP